MWGSSAIVRILIVEDEETLAKRIKNVFKRERYDVKIALDGSEGLDEALSETYDLVILDILLPEMNGIDVLKEIRQAGLKTPVLLLTARDRVQDKVTGLDAGADDYLTKPFATPELLIQLEQCVASLSTEQRQALTIRHNLGNEPSFLREQDFKRHYGFGWETLRKRADKARQLLRDCMR